MTLYSTYSVKIKHYNHIFEETVAIYREAVSFFINVCLNEWEDLAKMKILHLQQQHVEHLCHATQANAEVKYDKFDKLFYKFPSYLRRGAIDEAIGKVSSYRSNLARWEQMPTEARGHKPGVPKAGYTYPCMYRTGMYQETGTYESKIKIFIRNTWDWLTVSHRKSDVDYINRWCAQKTKCAPTLQRRGKEWFLDFPFEETIALPKPKILDQTVVSVDLGINASATVSVMRANGAVLGRHFLKLSKEYDSLSHAVNRIKKAQQHGNRKTPRLWAVANGINDDIAVKTAHFIMETAIRYDADVIVFEHLDLTGRKRGSKKQKLHLWRSQYVQGMVQHKAHRNGIRISRVCAWGTSRLAYDGSGPVERGEEAGLKSYSLCKFQNGKVYNCDLSASYNIGSRYFIREILKSLPERAGLDLAAKVPQVSRRSTCTLSTLTNLYAVLAGSMTQELSRGSIVETQFPPSKEATCENTNGKHAT